MNKNPIDISKSSLLSLKAEILRKQQEVNKAKLQAKCQNAIPKPKPRLPKNPGVEERNTRDISAEDEDELKKSRIALEAKSRLYDKLSKGLDIRHGENPSSQYLVQFDRKIHQTIDENKTTDTNNSSDDDGIDQVAYPSEHPDEDWVDYVDCLGRTRKCLRRDLAYLKTKDKELRTNLPPERTVPEEIPKPEWFIDTERIDDANLEQQLPSNITAQNELLSSDMRRELLRQQWEKQEDELRNKSDIHYQDVLFNEARSHGVGYFGFSHDEQERAKQQEDLKKLREETKQKQNTVQELRAMRDQQMAARAKAARNRKRARMGLPPEEDEPEQEPMKQTEIEIEIEKRKAEQAAAEVKAEELKQAARQKQVRPWDIGKDGISEVKTQEEWVQEKRNTRPKEFAPPLFYRGREPSYTNAHDVPEDDNSLFFTSKNKKRTHNWKNYTEDKTEVIPPSMVDTSQPPPNYKKNNYATHYESLMFEDVSKVPLPSSNSVNPYKHTAGSSNRNIPEIYDPFENESATTEIDIPKTNKTTPIVNECIDFDDEQDAPYDTTFNSKEPKRTRAEIPPPLTFEYQGIKTPKLKKAAQPMNEIRASIEAGLKYLRNQAEKKHAQTDDVGFFE